MNRYRTILNDIANIGQIWNGYRPTLQAAKLQKHKWRTHRFPRAESKLWGYCYRIFMRFDASHLLDHPHQPPVDWNEAGPARQSGTQRRAGALDLRHVWLIYYLENGHEAMRSGIDDDDDDDDDDHDDDDDDDDDGATFWN